MHLSYFECCHIKPVNNGNLKSVNNDEINMGKTMVHRNKNQEYLSSYLRAQTTSNYNESNVEINICDRDELKHDNICFEDYAHYQKLNGYNTEYLFSKNWIKSIFAFMFQSAHTWMIPVLPVLIFQSILVLLMDDYMIVPVFILFVISIAVSDNDGLIECILEGI